MISPTREPIICIGHLLSNDFDSHLTRSFIILFWPISEVLYSGERQRSDNQYDTISSSGSAQY